MRLGTLAHLGTVANSCVFVVVVLMHNHGSMQGVLTPAFLRDGFCIYDDNPHFESHVLSFYADMVLAIAMWAVVATTLRSHPPMQFLKDQIAGVVMHGLAHLSVHVTGKEHLEEKRMGLEVLASGDMTGPRMLFEVTLASLFFVFVLKGTPGGAPGGAVLSGLLHGLLLKLVIPSLYGFAYVQFAILVTIAVAGLMRKDKDELYDFHALTTVLPISLMSWAEGCMCESFFRAIGGHVWYDAMIPFFFLTYSALILAGVKGKVFVSWHGIHVYNAAKKTS